MTVVRLNKINQKYSDICVECNEEKGTLFNCLCKIKIYKVKCISQIILKPVPHCPKLCLLGLYPEDCALKSRKRR